MSWEPSGADARRIDMRASRLALAGLLVTVVTVGGCTGGDAAPPTPAPSTSGPSTVTPSASAQDGVGTAPLRTTPPPKPRPTSGATVPPSEIPGPLPGPERRLTGTVDRAGGCAVLVVGERRWALLGRSADRLAAGARIRVSGRLTALPPGCDADMAVAVTRVEPA
jgi:hypothetical protein